VGARFVGVGNGGYLCGYVAFVAWWGEIGRVVGVAWRGVLEM